MVDALWQESASLALSNAGPDTLRAYEDAATATGRLDAAAGLAPAGLREVLVLRCIATPSHTTHQGMIALLRSDGEGDRSLRAYGRALREGAARARGGVLPTVALLDELVGRAPRQPDAAATYEQLQAIDALLQDARERTPPVLKAVLAAAALRHSLHAPGAPRRVAPDDHESDGDPARIAALAVTFVLCVGGAITDAWLTLPPPRDAVGAGADLSLRAGFTSLAREARAAEQGLAAARERCDRDESRIRESLGRAAYSALDVFAALRERVVISVPETARALGLTPPTAGAAIARLVELDIAREVTGKARSRAFAYEGIVRDLAP